MKNVPFAPSALAPSISTQREEERLRAEQAEKQRQEADLRAEQTDLRALEAEKKGKTTLQEFLYYCHIYLVF
jgi:hypothetical protein